MPLNRQVFQEMMNLFCRAITTFLRPLFAKPRSLTTISHYNVNLCNMQMTAATEEPVVAERRVGHYSGKSHSFFTVM